MTHTLLFMIFMAQRLVLAQTPGNTTDVHPKLQTWKCSKAGGCVAQNNGIVLDALGHNIHQVGDINLSCDGGNDAPNSTVCPDQATCAKNCLIEGITDYSARGVSTQDDSLTLTQLSATGDELSPRVYLLTEGNEKYEMLQLTGNEFSFDVDVSKLPCGMNGALYLSEMEEAGGQNDLNPAGPAYGTGYCDAQCFKRSFINGVANVDGKGACCNEMDIWEANARATQLAPHPCNESGLYLCTGDECGSNGVCDKGGCSQNPYRIDPNYYGPALKVDTKRPFTVVTQFPADNGTLSAIRRLYVQDGIVIQNVMINSTGAEAILDKDYCDANGPVQYNNLGGTEAMGGALSRGMVLAFSVWWDKTGFMEWLDTGSSGPCNATEGDPKIIQQIQPDTAVTFSQIKWGEIDSTYSAGQANVTRYSYKY